MTSPNLASFSSGSSWSGFDREDFGMKQTLLNTLVNIPKWTERSWTVYVGLPPKIVWKWRSMGWPHPLVHSHLSYCLKAIIAGYFGINPPIFRHTHIKMFIRSMLSLFAIHITGASCTRSIPNSAARWMSLCLILGGSPATKQQQVGMDQTNKTPWNSMNLLGLGTLANQYLWCSLVFE